MLSDNLLSEILVAFFLVISYSDPPSAYQDFNCQMSSSFAFDGVDGIRKTKGTPLRPWAFGRLSVPHSAPLIAALIHRALGQGRS